MKTIQVLFEEYLAARKKLAAVEAAHREMSAELNLTRGEVSKAELAFNQGLEAAAKALPLTVTPT